MIRIGKTEEFYKTWPKVLTPAKNGGTASEEAAFSFLEEQLRIRAKNEKEFKL